MENPSDTTAPPLHEEGGQTRRIARSTAVFSLATAVSRVLGLMREMVSAYYFGVAGAINAFTVAIQIPNLVRALVADAALSGAFVPVFSELLERGEKQRAWRVASTLLADPPRPRRSHGALHPARTASHAAVRGSGRRLRPRRGLSRVLFPIVVLLGLSGIVVGILNTYHHFALPALAPVAWNLVIIGLLIGVPRIDDEMASSISTPALSSSERSSSCCCRSRGFGGSTAASRWSSTGGILQFAACSR